MSLGGATVLVTRNPERAGEMAIMIEQRGGVPVLFPALDIGPPPSWLPCDETLARLASFDAAVFQSVNAVNGFFGRCRARGIQQNSIERLRLFAVGPATREAIERFGFSVRATPGNYNAASLLAMLRDQPLGSVILPRGTRGSGELADGLRARGIAVEPVPVYDSVVSAGDASVRDRLASGEIDVVTFASPSAVEGVAAALDPVTLAEIRSTTAIAVIGPTTLEAVRSSGADADIVAHESTVPALLDAIERYLTQHTHE
jgi:uroporphyrinogen III methyltransferase/synthase